MFDLQAKDGSVRGIAAPPPDGGWRTPRPDVDAEGAQKTAQAALAKAQSKLVGRLDTPQMDARWRRMMGDYVAELDRQYENRKEMALDADFYDNDQWRAEDIATLEGRGQVPIVYNVIATSVDWLTGTEKRTRSDFKILPRRKEHSQPAQRKTDLIKYLSDVNRTPFHVSRAFTDSVKVGLGWIEDGVNASTGEEPLYSRYESWRNMLWDSAATNLDLSDARYIYRTKWVDLDVAIAKFPHRAAILEQAASHVDDRIMLDEHGDEAMDAVEIHLDGGTHSRGADRVEGYERKRVRLIEGWVYEPGKVQRLRGGEFSGEIYDPHSAAHREQISMRLADAVTIDALRLHVGIMCDAGMLYWGESPYRHNRFPFTPIWGKRRDRDGMPYGMVRRLRSIQEDVNKRASKALHILSTNRVLYEEGAIPEGWTEAEWIEEAGRPDGALPYRTGKKVEFDDGKELAPAHLDLMSRGISMIQQAGGVTDELMGRTTNARSGIAIQRRQDQGVLTTADYFDNLRFAKQVSGEKQLANVEQFMDEHKAFRITNQRGKADYAEVNDGLPENDIVRSKADFVISEADWRASTRQAAVDELLDLLGKVAPVNPQLVVIMVDLLVESMDIANREEIVKRIRQVTGMRDPDSDEMTPEEQAKAQAAAEDTALQREAVVADVQKKKADGALAAAKAEQVRAQTVGANVTAQQGALAAAKEAILLPEAASVADFVMAESGFVSASDKKAALATVVAGMARQQQPQMQPAGVARPAAPAVPQPVS